MKAIGSTKPRLRFTDKRGGEYPEWRIVKLGSSVDCLDNRRIPLNESEREKKKGEIPYWGANGIVDYIDDYIFNDTLILLAEDGGHFDEFSERPIACITRGKCWVNNHAHVLRAQEEKVYSEFLYFSLVHKNILGFVSGGTRKKLNKLEMLKIPIYLPHMEEQQKIAGFLSAVDEKIEQLERKRELLEHYKKGLLQNLFRQELRFKDERGGEYPEWRIVKLGSSVDCLDNRRIPLNESEREKKKGEIPYWGANGIVDYIDDYIFDDTLILLAEDGGHFDEFSERPIACITRGKCWVNNHAHVLRAHEEKVDSEFLYFSLVHKNILGFVSGGTRKKLNKLEMLKIPIYLPHMEEQQKIADFLSAVDKKIQHLNTQIELSCTFKHGLLQQLFV